jgi:E3 ubiquitin-protein ligase BRE1
LSSAPPYTHIPPPQKKHAHTQAAAARLARLSSKLGADEQVAELEAENSKLHDLLRCKVCSTNRKNVILLKCSHMFCKPCIDATIDNRHRKCPGCGAAFSAADVRPVFF